MLGGAAVDDPDRARETELLAGAHHHPENFDELFRRTWPYLVRRLTHQTFDAEIAADIAAETFARAVVSCKRFDPSRGSARTWLWTMALNLMRDWFRHGTVQDRYRRKLRVEVVAPVDVLAEVVDRASTSELRGALAEALATISSDARELVRLRVVDECSYDEIGLKLGCSPAAAKMRFSRAIAALREALESPVEQAGWA